MQAGLRRLAALESCTAATYKYFAVQTKSILKVAPGQS